MAKGNLVWKPWADGMEVAVEMHIDGELKAHILFDAATLEDNIHMLAKARAGMKDQVTPKLEAGMRLEAIVDPAWQTEARHDAGGVMLALRHPGFGWVSFLLPQTEAQALGASLTGLSEELGAKSKPEES